ncbi:MAG: HAD family hydrolase [Promethearchaeota archaeon]
MDKIKVIILDFDGTLYNNISAMKAATADALKRFEIDYAAEMALAETTRLIEKIRSSALSKILLRAWELLGEVKYLEDRKFLEKAEIIFYAYTLFKDYTKECTLFAGVTDLLKNAKTRYKIAIVTSGSRVDTIALLKEFNIYQYVDAFISADDVEFTKPNPEGINKILEELQISPDEAVYIGDLILDIKAGKNAGIKTIAVATGLVPRIDLEIEKPDKIVRHITEISTILPGLSPVEIDIEADLEKDIKERREFVPISEEKRPSFTDRLKSISISDLKDILKRPFKFIREKLNEFLEDIGTTNIQDALTVFEGAEDDLLRVVGLFTTHAIDERLNDVLFKMFQTEYGGYLGYLNFEFIEQTTKTLFPDIFFAEIRDLLLIITKNILPEGVYNGISEMDPYDFISYFFEGIKLGMSDLGMEPFELREFIGDKFADDEIGVIEFIWELVRTLFIVTINIIAIPMKLALKQSTPFLKDAILVTLESYSRIFDTINTNIIDKSEKFGRIGEIIQKMFPKSQESDENSNI